MLNTIFWWVGCVLCVTSSAAFVAVSGYSALEFFLGWLKFKTEFCTWLYYRRAWSKQNPGQKFVLPADLRGAYLPLKNRADGVVDLCDNIMAVLEDEGYGAAAGQLREAVAEYRVVRGRLSREGAV